MSFGLHNAYYEFKIYKTREDRRSNKPIFSTENEQQRELLRKSLVSFSVKEAQGQVPTLTITFTDNSGWADVLMSYLVTIDLKWGLINKPYPPSASLLTSSSSSDEIQGNEYSRSYLFYTQQRSATISEGKATYSVQCRAGKLTGGKRITKTIKDGKLKNVLTNLAKEYLEADDVIIDFQRPDPNKYFDKTGNKNSKFYPPLNISNKSPIAFFNDYCKENNLRFYFHTYDDNGTYKNKIYIIDDKASVTIPTDSLRGVKGEYHILNYMTANANIISADMDTSNNTPAGSNGYFVTDPNDGKLSFVATPANQETVQVYELNEKAVEAELQKSGGFKSALAVVQDIVSRAQLTQDLIEKYFIIKNQTTAPEGTGYIVKVNCLPNPLYYVGDKFLFCPKKKGDPKNAPVPDLFRTYQDDSYQWKKVYNAFIIEHEISGSGAYQMKLELVQGAPLK